MRIAFQAVNFTAEAKLIEFSKKRVQKFTQFYDRIVGIEVFAKLENASDKINKQIEIKIDVPGENVIVKKTCKTFEEALDTAASSAERVLKKRKEKAKD